MGSSKAKSGELKSPEKVSILDDIVSTISSINIMTSNVLGEAEEIINSLMGEEEKTPQTEDGKSLERHSFVDRVRFDLKGIELNLNLIRDEIRRINR